MGPSQVMPGADGVPIGRDSRDDRADLDRPGQTEPGSETMTTIFISNLHCTSCARLVEQTVGQLARPVRLITLSIVTQSVVVAHPSDQSVHPLIVGLTEAGLEIHTVFQRADTDVHDQLVLTIAECRPSWQAHLQHAIAAWKPVRSSAPESSSQGVNRRLLASSLDVAAPGPDGKSDKMSPMRAAHLASCEMCANSLPSPPQSATMPAKETEKTETVSECSQSSTTAASLYEATIAVGGLTCSSCVGTVTAAVSAVEFVQSVEVSLLDHTATVVYSNGDTDQIERRIVDAGFDPTVLSIRRLPRLGGAVELWRTAIPVGGMTCASCVATITDALNHLDHVQQVTVSLIDQLATVEFSGPSDGAVSVHAAIVQAGFCPVMAPVDRVNQAEARDGDDGQRDEREVFVTVAGMTCRFCPVRISDALGAEFGSDVKMDDQTAYGFPVVRLRYRPQLPSLTIRRILAIIRDTNPLFDPAIFHPPTAEEQGRLIQRHDQMAILMRLVLCLAAAIPAFIIGIVLETLLPQHHRLRQFAMAPLWAGSVSRSAWALFILATPVYFFAADQFHRKTIREIRALWRPHSPVRLIDRFTRFGSMNMLLCFATSIAYFASLAELGIAATNASDAAHADTDHGSMGGRMYYFDSVIFLTLFVLAGRFLEAVTKARTGDAVVKLGRLRPSTATLVETDNPGGVTVSVDELEVGDVVRVPVGSSPPFDGVVMSGETCFDESSLTGESVGAAKRPGEAVFTGTVNQTRPVLVRIGRTTGVTMLDQIIAVVRQGQARRAPVEKVADTVTSHFVPVVVLVAIITWAIWLGLGLGGALPDDYLDSPTGGYPLWSLRFAIAVFVIACPCGIGLAAPTALFVGGGLAAEHGILAKGGGEAFQQARSLSAVIFDKTGTLTDGGDPQVADFDILHCSTGVVARIIDTVEAESSHVLARAVAARCRSISADDPSEPPASPLTSPATGWKARQISEIAGKGMHAILDCSSAATAVEAVIGNETLMAEHGVVVPADQSSRLEEWKQRGHSVVLAALRSAAPVDQPGGDFHQLGLSGDTFQLVGVFAIADSIRPEAASVVAELTRRQISVWMISGDNRTTAIAVAHQVGIPPSNVFAGVLPEGKSERVNQIRELIHHRRAGKTANHHQQQQQLDLEDLQDKPTLAAKHSTRTTVAMVGDGINDSPALTAADVGIAIGSGSDIAISSADFILVHSRLDAVVTLIDLSKKVFRRVWFNFGWAFVYNVLAMPVAAGVLYPIVTRSGNHVRLDPVWASLAMAGSSLSVVVSSLLLRSSIPGIGFRPKQTSSSSVGRARAR